MSLKISFTYIHCAYRFVRLGHSTEQIGSGVPLEWIGIFLEKESSSRDDFRVQFTVQLRNIGDWTLERKAAEFVPGAGWGWNHFVEMDEIFDPKANLPFPKFIKDGHWTLILTVRRTTEIYYQANYCFMAQVELSHAPEEAQKVTALPSNPLHAYDTTFTDFMLKSSNGDSFPVHKIVLAANSKFFEKFLSFYEHLQKEVQNAQVGYVFEKSEDVSTAALKEVLRFMYNEKIEIQDYKEAVEILHAANKFEMKKLEDVCVENLMDSLEKENVVECLKVADKFGAKELEKECLDMIVK